MRNRYLLGAGVALAITFGWANAQAQFLEMPGGPGKVYFGGEGGWTHLDDATARTHGLKAKETFSDGFNVGARLGYEWGPLDIEEEFRWQQNDISHFGPVAVSGIRDAYAFMTNAIYNFNLGFPIPIVPHVGVGVGAVELRDGISVPHFGTVVGGTDWELGYQGIAGIRYNVNPSLAFDVDYRYLGTTDPTFHFRGAAAGLGTYKSEYSSHSVLASFIVKFGAPPPPPPPPPVAAPPAPPAPAPVVRKVFLVFFDWDKATITPEGMRIVAQAAATWRSGTPVQIQVTGYTDTSGSAGYNQRLSERRANNVAVAMIRYGVPRSEMAVSGRGKNDLRVPTADGVREPQNRRVEIVFP